MGQTISDIFIQLHKDKDAALKTLLSAAIMGEKIILVEQHDSDARTIKYQYRFEKGELPPMPASIHKPCDDEGNSKFVEKLDRIIELIESITEWADESGTASYPGPLTKIRMAIEGR